jgi:hypothetical protein
MKSFPAKEGPYPVRLIYEPQEIDLICEDALRTEKLLPKTPEPIKVDLFLERYFRVRLAYEDLGTEIMGCTVFNTTGAVTGFIISTRIEEDGKKSSERRARSTIAHEGGHGLLHSRLFMADTSTGSIFGKTQPQQPKIMCRPTDIRAAGSNAKAYDGKWWEWQANRAIAGLLLPKKLVHTCVSDLLISKGITPELPATKKAEAENLLADTFDVNPVVARIRLQEMFPVSAQIFL